jgi:hypothetical protein
MSDVYSLIVKTRKIVYLLFEELRALLLPLFQCLNWRDMP